MIGALGKILPWVFEKGKHVPLRPFVLILLVAVPASAYHSVANLATKKGVKAAVLRIDAQDELLESNALAHERIVGELRMINALLERNHEDTRDLLRLLRAAATRELHADEHTGPDPSDR